MVEKVIHQIVGPKTNQLIDTCLGSWNKLTEQGFQVKLWNDETINRFIEQHFNFALPAVLNARNHGEASDIARYLIVHHYGGHYMDWDIQLLDAEGFLEICDMAPDGYLVIDPYNDTLASECFSASRGEQYLISLVNDIVDLYNSGMREDLITPQYSGPYRMRDSLVKHDNSMQELIDVNDIFMYNYREIRDMPKREYLAPLIHYWVHSWM